MTEVESARTIARRRRKAAAARVWHEFTTDRGGVIGLVVLAVIVLQARGSGR